MEQDIKPSHATVPLRLFCVRMQILAFKKQISISSLYCKMLSQGVEIVTRHGNL